MHSITYYDTGYSHGSRAGYLARLPCKLAAWPTSASIYRQSIHQSLVVTMPADHEHVTFISIASVEDQ